MEGLGEVFGRATAAELALACSYALIAGAAAAEGLELLVKAGPDRVRRWPVAARLALGGLLAGAAVSWVYRLVWPPLSGLAPPGLVMLWRDHPPLGAIAAFVLWDAAGYAYHRLGHGTGVGWASHQVHHGGQDYDLSLAWRQPWFPVHALVVFPAVALTGVGPAAVAVSAAISNTWQALLHTHRRVDLPRLVDLFVMTPARHRRHHLSSGPTCNLGPVLTVWDRLAGTWDPRPVDERTASYGIGRPDAGGAWRVERQGWVDLLGARQVIAARTASTTRSATTAGPP